MSSQNGGSGVPIPKDALRVIRDIKATTGMKHTDEDVYEVLKQCAMDPDETAQKLLYLDTFQVFKSKREKKREILNSKVSQRQWARGYRNFSSRNGFSGGLRNLPAQRENRGNGFQERASGPASSQQKSDDTTVTNEIKPSTVVANGPSHLPNGVPGPAKTPTLKEVLLAGVASAPVGAKPLPSGNSVKTKKVANKSKQVEKAEVPQPLKPNIVEETAEKDNGLAKEASLPVEVITSGVASVSVEASSQSSPTSVDSQNVTFPDNFAVFSFTNGLTFGSFGASSIDDVNPTAQPSQESNIEESSPSNQAGEVAEHSQPSSLVQDETTSTHENNCNHEEQLSNTLLPTPEDSQNHVVQDGQNTFGFLSSMSNGQTEASELQSQELSHPLYLANGTAPTHSSPSPTPTTQNSSPSSPQQIPVYRQPYPLGYMPYGHYLTPFYMPHMHQMLGHNGFVQQQPSAGNMYLPPTMAAAAAGSQQGLKLPYPMYKPGTNTPVGIPSGYSVYGNVPTSLGYNASPTSTTSVNNEDLAASQLKGNHVYSSAPLSEAPAAMWIPQGQDLNSLQQLNSLYNLPQGQQITERGAFGVQQPQTMPGVPTAQTLTQQSHAGDVETAGLPSGGTFSFLR